jgi:hypothetical protein
MVNKMTQQENDDLIKELIALALELGANKFYINKIILSYGINWYEAIYRGLINDDEKAS